MTIQSLDSVSWFGEKHSFSIEGMQGNAKGVPIGRATRYDTFPPPLESPTVCDGNFSHISQVDRVCLPSVRRDGRLILIEKPQPLLPQRSIRSQRSNGRLQLRLYVDNPMQNQHKKENPIAKISSLTHEQHYPLASNNFNVQKQHNSLASNNFNVQKQHNSLAAVSLSKHGPFSENALRPGHPQQKKPLAKSVSHKHSSIATYALQETNTLPGHHPWDVPIAKSFFSSDQNRPSRVTNNSLHGYCRQRPSAKEIILLGPIQHNPSAEFGKVQKSKAENARHHVCVQEQRNLAASIAFSAVEHRQQSPMAESSLPQQLQHSPNAEIERGESPDAEIARKRLQHSPNAKIEREKSPDAEIARKRNQNAEIANPIAEIDSREEPGPAEIARRGKPTIAENGAKKRNQRAGSKKTREEKGKQENASARLSRGEGHDRDPLKQSRVLMKCDAYNNSGYTTQAFNHFYSEALPFSTTPLGLCAC